MARNALLSDFKKGNKEYILFLDDDNVPESLDFIDKLLEVNQPVVTGLVPSRLPD